MTPLHWSLHKITQGANYSTEALIQIKTIHDANHYTGALIQTTQDNNY